MRGPFAVRIYLIALALRLFPILLTRGLGIGLDDMFQYDMLARSLASGNGYRWYAQADLNRLAPYINLDPSQWKGYDPEHGVYTSFRAPLYPAFLAIVYFINGSGFSRFFAARLAQAVLLGAPLAPLTYAVANLFWSGEPSDRIAKISAWIVACYPILLVYPLGLGTENPFFVLLLASFLFLLKSLDNPSRSNFVFGGLFLGLTALTRSVVLPFGALAVVFLIYKIGWKALWIGIVMLAVVTPWIVRNSLLHKQLTGIESSLGYNLYLGYHPQGNGSFVVGPSLDLLSIMDDSERDEFGAQKAIQFIKDQPARFLPLAVDRLGYFFGLEKRVLIYFYSNNILGFVAKPILILLAAVLWLPFVVLSVSTALALPFLNWNPKTVLLLLLFLGYLIPHVFILSEDRFHLALIPFFAVLTARLWDAGISSLFARWDQSSAGKWRVCVSLLCVCLLLFNWGAELSRDADKIALLLGPRGNETYFPY